MQNRHTSVGQHDYPDQLDRRAPGGLSSETDQIDYLARCRMGPDTPPSIESRNQIGMCDLVSPMEGNVIPTEEHIEALLEFGIR